MKKLLLIIPICIIGCNKVGNQSPRVSILEEGGYVIITKDTVVETKGNGLILETIIRLYPSKLQKNGLPTDSLFKNPIIK